MEFWRGEVYTKYFEYLDSKGGFYYEVRRHCRRVLTAPSPMLFNRDQNASLAVGRRPRAQHRGLALPEQGPDPLLRRDRLRAQPVHALSQGRRRVETRQVRLRRQEQLRCVCPPRSSSPVLAVTLMFGLAWLRSACRLQRVLVHATVGPDTLKWSMRRRALPSVQCPVSSVQCPPAFLLYSCVRRAHSQRQCSLSCFKIRLPFPPTYRYRYRRRSPPTHCSPYLPR